ncbi:MAG: hypothetical protein JNJ44_08420 [Zoogloeaceae bacterium]|nr:hypothetical protein [Zoogloeaceae bacterium]
MPSQAGRPGGRGQIWTAAFLAMALGAGLGAVAHGWVLPPATNVVIWHGIHLALGLSMALFVAGALEDGWGLGRRVLPTALIIGALFPLASWLAGGSFAVFLLSAMPALVGVFGVYLRLARQHFPGAGSIAAAMALQVVAGGVQASRWGWAGPLPLDHNGLFHLVQMGAVGVLSRGLRQGRYK